MIQCSEQLHQFDPELASAIDAEATRQEDHLELIASENYASENVMALQGSVLTNKYAEGLPGKRYYGGCEFVDIAESLAIDRVKQLFGADYANVQPHSGSQANAAVYHALLQPGDTILGMALNAGGHLTHGAKPSVSGKIFNAVQYGVNPKTGLIDYKEIRALALEHKPKLIIGGFSAYSQIIDWRKLRKIANEVNAYLFVDMAHVAGLVAAGLYPNPIPHADVVTTTTHKTLRGPRGGLILAKANPELTKKFDSLVFPGTQGGPLMHVIAAKALSFKEALSQDFKAYQAKVVENAKTMASTIQLRGYDIVSGGTENHMILIDLTQQNITGKDAEAALEAANITTNKNTVPNEKLSPFVTSGLRIGTPAITTRGFGVAECQMVANWLCDVLDNINNSQAIADVKQHVIELCKQFPVYPQTSNL